VFSAIDRLVECELTIAGERRVEANMSQPSNVVLAALV